MYGNNYQNSNNYQADPFRNIQNEGRGSYAYFKNHDFKSRRDAYLVLLALLVFAILLLTFFGVVEHNCGPIGELGYIWRHFHKPAGSVSLHNIGKTIDIIRFL